MRNVNMRVRESIRAVGEIARRELPINLRRAHCLQLLFAFSLAFDLRHYSKWQACRISPFVANLSAHNKNTCQRRIIMSNHAKTSLFLHIVIIFLYCTLICLSYLYVYIHNFSDLHKITNI